MKMVKIILLVLLAIIVLGCLFGWSLTIRSQRSANNKLFNQGSVAAGLPEGEYKGSVTGYNGSWRGKQFNADQTGINVFADGQRYPFKMYLGNGAIDRKLKVIKIDYNLKSNPIWLRFILDEIVETSPGSYLGKIHVRVIPGLPFTLGYFRLTKV